MKTRILGLLAVGLLAGPMAANAGFLYTFEIRASGGASPPPDTTFSFESPNLLSTAGGFSFTPFSYAGATFTQGFFGGGCFAIATASVGAGSSCGFNADPDTFPTSSVLSVGRYTNPTAVGSYSTIGGGSLRSGNQPFFVFFEGLTISEVPEPGTLALLGLGLAGLGLTRRRKAN